MSAINPVNLERMRALQAGGAPGFLTKIINVFLDESAVRVPELRRALQSREGSLLERGSHTLKGTCGALGADTLSHLCADLHLAAQAREWERCAELTKKIEDEYATVRTELEAERDGPGRICRAPRTCIRGKPAVQFILNETIGRCRYRVVSGVPPSIASPQGKSSRGDASHPGRFTTDSRSGSDPPSSSRTIER